MNTPEAQAAAVEGLRNADERQLMELVGVLTTCCHGFITIPPQPTPPILARRAARRRSLPDGPVSAPKPAPEPNPFTREPGTDGTR